MATPQWGHPHATRILNAGHDGTTDWHDLRRTGIGSSDAAALMGEGYKGTSAHTVWQSKVDPQPEHHDTQTLLLFARGHALEPHVAERFLDEHPDGDSLQLRRCGMLRSRKHDFLTCSPDRLVSDGGGLELKTANLFAFKRHAARQDAPRVYYWQAVHSLLVTGKSHWYIACLHPDTFRLLWWRIDADDQRVMVDMHRLLLHATHVWDHVTAGTPPEVAPTSSTEMNARITPTSDTLDLMGADPDDRDSILALVERRREIAELLDPLQAEKKTLDEALKLAIAGNETATIGGEFLYSYRAHKTRRLDQAALKRDHPDIAAQYTTTSTVRRLTFTPPTSKETN